jgi:AcrR family transcriptional regulator
VEKADATSRVMMQPSPEMMARVRKAFHDYGFRELSMGTLAEACGYTRRNLYNYFRNKEEAFRALVNFTNTERGRSGIEAGRALMEQKGSALDVVSAVLVTRYASVWNDLSRSPHVNEINDAAFRLCRDIMVRTVQTFHTGLKTIIVDLEKDGRLRLRPEITAAQLAQMLGDGVRGINQGLPPLPSTSLPARYRLMCQAILFGCATDTAVAAARKPVRGKKEQVANSE